MNRINLILPDSAVTGKQVSFIAPCGSDNAECIVINNVDYIICDAAGNNLAGIADIWVTNAFVSVIIDTNSTKAYIQNAATNKYLEEKFGTIVAAVADIQDPIISGNMDINGNIYTLTMPRESGLVDTIVAEFDANGHISKTIVNGREILWTVTGV